MAYDSSIDYQALINQAVAKGDYAAAAKYEQQRNEKIADLDASGTNVYGAVATDKYSGYLNSSSGYTPLNATSAAGINYENYKNEVAKQKAYVAANPTAAQSYTADEKYSKYGDIIDSTVKTGYYTKDAAAAQAAADKYGVSVTPTSYDGQEGWYLVGRAQRAKQEGTSGADEDLLSDSDYAIVQSLKADYAEAQENYNAAVAAGNTALAERYQAAMDEAHLEAERIRAGYNYSGGSDGSMYITYGKLNQGGDSGSSGGSSSSGSRSSRSSGSSSGSGNSGESGSDSGSSGSSGWYSGLEGTVNDYSAYLEQMYAAKRAAALAQLQTAYESSLAELERAGEGIAGQYQSARGSTAGASELAKRNFNEYAAAAGLNSGTGGQAELARNVTLQNNLNVIDAGEAEAIAQLQLQRAQVESEYNAAVAKAQAEGDYELAYALYQEKVRVEEALIELEIQQQKYALQWYQATK